MSSLDDLTQSLRRRLVDEATRLDRPESEQRSLRERVAALVHEQAAPLDGDQHDLLVEHVLTSAVGLGPLEGLMHDPEVDEVMVNGPGAVWIERRGRVERTPVEFTSVEQLKAHIDAFIEQYNGDAEPFMWTKSKVHQRRVKGRRLSDL